MKFGTPELSELDELDLTLPEDHPDTVSFKNPDKGTKVFIGCSAWNMDEWVGSVFPEKTKKKDYLAEYMKRFNCVELNSTFYNVKKANMQSWAEQAKDNHFKFCPKFNRRISHIKRLKEDIFEFTDYFAEMCLNFGDNLGMTFLQMPENFGPKWFERLRDFLENLPKELPVAVELRHPEWFQGEAFDETFHLLNELGKTAVITDTALKRDIIHQRLTEGKVFVRFAGYEDHPTNETRLMEWSKRLKNWSDRGVSEVYFFCKHEDETFSANTADFLIRQVNQNLGLKLRSPFDPVDG